MPVLPPVVIEYKARIDELKSKLGEARSEIQSTQATTESVGSKMRANMGTMSTAIGGSMAMVGGFATSMAGSLATANADLEAAVGATGKSMDDYKSQIEKADKTAERFGRTTDDTNEALAKLTRVTGDTDKALGDMKLVTEVAAAKHISLADAADLVGKMTMGNSKAFKQFGVDMKAVEAAGGGVDQAMAEVQKRLGDTAENQANTFHGKLSAIEAKLKDAAAVFGEKFGPALMGVGAILTTLQPILAASAIEIGSIELPVVAVVAALAVLGVAVYEVWTNWSGIWGAIKNVVSGAWQWIQHHLLLITLLFGPFIGTFVVLGEHWRGVWDGITGAVSAAWSFISGIFDKIKQGVQDVVKGVNSIPGVGILKSVGGGVGNAIGAVGGALFRAGGGPVASGTAYLVGEHGPEMFVPSGGGRVTGAPVGAGPVSLTFNISGAADPEATARAVRDTILRLKRSNISGGLF